MTKKELAKIIVRQEKDKQDLIENSSRLCAENEELMDQLDKAHKTIENYKEHSKGGDSLLVKRNMKIRRLKETVETLRKGFEASKEDILEKDGKIAKLNKLIKAKNVFIDNQAKEIHKLTNQLNTLARMPNHEQLNIDYLEQRLKTCSDDNVKLAADYTEMEAELTKYKEERKTLIKSLGDKANEIIQIDNRRKLAIERNVELTRDIDVLETVRDNLNHQVDTLERQVKGIQEDSNETNDRFCQYIDFKEAVKSELKKLEE